MNFSYDSIIRPAFIFIVLFTAIVHAILGGMVLSDSPRRKVNQLFLALSSLLSLWGLAMVGLNCSTPAGLMHQTWTRIMAIPTLFIPPVFYHLSLGSISHSSKTPIFGAYERVRQLAYVFSASWLALIVLGVFPAAPVQAGPVEVVSLGAQFRLASAVFAVLSVVTVVLLLTHSFRAIDGSQRSRLNYLLVGITLMLGGQLGRMLAEAVTPETAPLAMLASYVMTLIAAGILAYSFTTTQLYHISEMMRKMLAFSTMTALLLSVFGGAHLACTVFIAKHVPHSDIFALLISSIIISLLFHPLRYRVQNFVDRIFFAKRYDQMQRLRGLARRVLSSADREELMNVLFSSLHSIGFSSVSILLKDPQRGVFTIRKSFGLAPEAEGASLPVDSLLVQHLREEKQELVREVLTRRILIDWERQSINDEMDLLKAQVAFPLFSTRRRALFGVITLGNSDLGYSSYKGRNIFWLKSVIDNAGIMLDNFYHQDLANALIPYVGRAWATEMRRNKDGFRERLAGHRTWVAVMMVDIRHFTTMCGRMDPKEVVDLLKEFRSRVAPIVYRYQGTIDKFIGDAVMIVFGLPILPPLANPDQNAVECAVSIMSEIRKMNVERQALGAKEPVSIGIGVSSGEVIAGNVDSGDRTEYTVVGHAANMVARLEDMAGDNQILISPATHERIAGSLATKPWPARRVAGFENPIIVHEILTNEEENPNELRPEARAAND